MENVIKVYMGMFFILAMVALGISLLSMSIEARAADSFAADCVCKIENSNYAAPVIEACREDALNKGYDLSVETFSAGGMTPTYGNLSLEYDFTVPMLGVKTRRNITSFMR